MSKLPTKWHDVPKDKQEKIEEIVKKYYALFQARKKAEAGLGLEGDKCDYE